MFPGYISTLSLAEGYLFSQNKCFCLPTKELSKTTIFSANNLVLFIYLFIYAIKYNKSSYGSLKKVKHYTKVMYGLNCLVRVSGQIMLKKR